MKAGSLWGQSSRSLWKTSPSSTARWSSLLFRLLLLGPASWKTGNRASHKIPVLRIRIRDPVPFWPWIRDRFSGYRIPNPNIQIGTLMTNFWVKSTGTIILWVLAKKLFFTCFKNKMFFNLMIFVATKNCRTKKVFPLFFLVLLLDPRSGMDTNQDPGSATMQNPLKWIRNN